jgi:ubiquinone/menaquinone biosynthesis C-methylase UbiE
MTLSRDQVQAYYNRFGKLQDTQAFYEDAALDILIEHAAFDKAQAVFEFGCGTGRFAVRLLTSCLSPSATYTGIDLSETMVTIAQQRLSPYPDRARVIQSDGSIHYPIADQSVDRVVSTYVIDLLSETDIQKAISEAHRALAPDGKICLVSLSTGINFSSRMVCAIWNAVFNRRASLVGGCRPVQLATYLDENSWSIDYHKIITQFAVPSEILIAHPKEQQ